MLPCFHVPSSTRRGWRHTTGSGSGGQDKNLERAFLRFCIFCNPLKFHKTAKRIFGNPWTKQVEIWKCLAKKLGGQPTRPGDRPPFATLCDAMRKSPPFVRQATNSRLSGTNPPHPRLRAAFFRKRRRVGGLAHRSEVRAAATAKRIRPEMAPQRLEKIESRPGNGMGSETSNPQHLVHGRAADRARLRLTTQE